MRPRGRLRMVLDAKDGEGPVPETLDRSIVEIDVSHLQLRRAGHSAFITLHGKTMILRCDQHSTRAHFTNRMISAAMSVREFGGRAAERQPEKLMSEANPE